MSRLLYLSLRNLVAEVLTRRYHRRCLGIQPARLRVEDKKRTTSCLDMYPDVT